MHITHVTRYVREPEAMIQFYRDLFGFGVIADMPMPDGARWLSVGPSTPGALELVLMKPSEWMQNEALEQAEGQCGHQPALTLETDDIEALHAKVLEHGLKLDMPGIGTQPWGRDLSFRDPEGNGLYVVQPHPQA